jgi:septal ring factor EnvC (AmiA/AmiB activator)
MENQLAAPTEDGQPKSATQVVGDVLHQNTKTNHFLENVGIQITKHRTTLQNVQAEFEVERRTNSELRSIVNNQREEMDGLSKQVQETEQAWIKDQEENRKKQAELEKKVELLLCQNGQS